MGSIVKVKRKRRKLFGHFASRGKGRGQGSMVARWLQVFGPSGLKDYVSARLHCVAKFGLHPLPSNPAQSKERKVSTFAI